MTDFNLDEALANAEKQARTGTSKVQITAPAQKEEGRKLFQNKKANYAIGITFGVFILAIVILLLI